MKSSYYRYIFKTSFNINFNVPKTDRCEKCEEVRIKKTEKLRMTDEEKEQHEKHLAEKIVMREEKKKDKLLNKLICWSHSCVPQNRNSHISQALLEYLDSQDQIKKITMKYSLAGHSCVQEVDNMHQQIEAAIRVAEFYSPVSFLRLLLKVNRNNPFRVIQMSKDDFKYYQNSSKMLKFCNVPYTQVFQLRFSKN